MADQCIVCLENLETESSATPQLPTAVDAPPEPAVAAIEASKANGTSSDNGQTPNHQNHDPVALIQICGHVLHDSCLREWTEKANSCPICRQAFHLVHVYDKVGGTLLSSYKVEDKKQVAEFDQQAWLDENPEQEEEPTPCPVCNRADEEEILLLCDSCDTPYHTHCIGLDGVPRGSWFCMECVDALGPELTGQPPPAQARNAPRGNGRRSDFFPRTQASMRRARHRARSDDWQGAWGQVSARVFDGAGIDLDFHDEDDALEDYRRLQQVHEQERREHQRWQQRLNIASRLGARDVFENSIQNVFGQRRSPTPRVQAPVEQTPEERGAWRALEKAREREDGSSNSSRKRKSRSVTASPSEPRPEPEQERKLKRPRTRRLATQNGEASSSKSTVAASIPQAESHSSASNARLPPSNQAAPSFLSSLLKEVEMSTPSDDESIRHIWGHIPGANDASSPAPSPPASGYSSPRALSTTPPPHRNVRPTSPTLSLSSHIEPVYPPAKFSPTRSSPENSDSEPSNNRISRLELRQPRPRRSQPVPPPRSQDVSPSRTPLPLETKQDINNIVREALRPHWKSSQLTPVQYATINRDVSHKLYDEVTSTTAIDEEVKKNWEKMASKEVARAVSDLKVGP
ncbi:hypothetical protein CONLIGDRAFT_590642 [Coniochaeta ligniaria NRRL 30616]|uniref:PHD and RING finger domain-containing protein n=1 Tax=Coniochaeta ligniaria NRRL 30616 TaxID=1408157 RepID=A0A1J7J0V1_9PEZI|nr:hypothetical protein CONLIGDRAFT_590642 [Coniochaeta ligniaria NRRL 30616]